MDKLLNPTKKLKIFVRRSEIETSGSNLWGLKPISHLLPIANRLFIAILTTLFFEFNDTAFGFPELHLGHQFLPIYFDENRMVRTFGVGLWDTLYVRWSFSINVRFQSYHHVFKNKEFPEWGPPKYIIRLREYVPYIAVDYIPHELSEKTKLYVGVGGGPLVITRQNISPRIVKIVDSDTIFGEVLPPGYDWEDFEVPRIHAWLTPYVGIRYYIPNRGITLSLSLGLSYGFGRIELNNYLFLLGSIVLFMR